MRSQRHNVTSAPQKFYDVDKGRGLLIVRNIHATSTVYLQGGLNGSVASARDGFPILAGDAVAVDRGDVTDAIWLWSDTDHDSVIVLVA